MTGALSRRAHRPTAGPKTSGPFLRPIVEVFPDDIAPLWPVELIVVSSSLADSHLQSHRNRASISGCSRHIPSRHPGSEGGLYRQYSLQLPQRGHFPHLVFHCIRCDSTTTHLIYTSATCCTGILYLYASQSLSDL